MSSARLAPGRLRSSLPGRTQLRAFGPVVWTFDDSIPVLEVDPPMTILSHAQFHEDVLLSRLFPEQATWFYIDIGACHPSGHSVTKIFYDRGWRGINVEPGRAAFALLEAERTRDINLNVGDSDREDSARFFEAVESLGLSTFSPDWAGMWHEEYGWNFVEREARVRTLSSICRDHVDRPIDFLKCTVEGYESRAIMGGDWQRWRPRAVLVADRNREDWMPLLRDSGYYYATFDGLSLYFIRTEDLNLLPRLRFPVNHHHDDYVPVDHHNQLEELRATLAAAREELASRHAFPAATHVVSSPARHPDESPDRVTVRNAEIGPLALELARRIRLISLRHPRLASAVKRAILRTC